MSPSSIALIVVVTFAFAWHLAFGGRLPKAWRGRACQGRSWRRAFPTAARQDIREFLSLFVSAFAFDDREKLKLSPSDEILAIYRAQYPSRLQPDAMELETLALALKRRHGLDLDALWNDGITLGGLFAFVQDRKRAAA